MNPRRSQKHGSERPAASAKTPPSSRPAELVTVFKGGDPGRIALAKSLLESAEIRFIVLNEAMQDLVGMGRMPFGQNLIIGPVEIQVHREDTANALDLLKDLEPYRDRRKPDHPKKRKSGEGTPSS